MAVGQCVRLSVRVAVYVYGGVAAWLHVYVCVAGGGRQSLCVAVCVWLRLCALVCASMAVGQCVCACVHGYGCGAVLRVWQSVFCGLYSSAPVGASLLLGNHFGEVVVGWTGCAILPVC